MRIGIVGGGAIGTIVAARLATAVEVRLFVRSAEVARRIREDGLRVNGEPARRVDVTSDPSRAEGCDVVVVAVKTPATPSLAAYAPFLERDAIVLTLQNGLENDVRLSEALGTGVDVVLGPTTIGGTLRRPGRVENASVGPTTIGRLPDALATASLEPLVRTFEAAGLPAWVARDVRSALWSKLVVNGAINALAALHGVANGALLADAALRARCAELAREGAAVARASGVRVAFGDPVAYVEDVARATATNRNSMLQDLEAGRPTEIDALNAAIVRAALTAGIAVPAQLAIVDRMRKREALARDGASVRRGETRGPWPNDA